MDKESLKYWNMGHCVNKILTSSFIRFFLAIVQRPLLKCCEDRYSSCENRALARENIDADYGGWKELRPLPGLWKPCEI